jgi:hypothetical protein
MSVDVTLVTRSAIQPRRSARCCTVGSVWWRTSGLRGPDNLQAPSGCSAGYLMSALSIPVCSHKAHHFLGIAPQESENDNEYCKKWADKIINFMNNEIKWKYSNNFSSLEET